MRIKTLRSDLFESLEIGTYYLIYQTYVSEKRG